MKFWIIGSEEPQDRTADWAGQTRDGSQQYVTGAPPAQGDWIRKNYEDEGDGNDELGVVRDVQPDRPTRGWAVDVDWEAGETRRDWT